MSAAELDSAAAEIADRAYCSISILRPRSDEIVTAIFAALEAAGYTLVGPAWMKGIEYSHSDAAHFARCCCPDGPALRRSTLTSPWSSWQAVTEAE